VGLLQMFSTNRKLEELENELRKLKRDWESVLQEWDACQARVSKVLRRIARAEQARDQAEPETVVEGEGTSPLTTVPTTPDRMARIRAQLAAKGR
jgi:prefoldin subunit 5